MELETEAPQGGPVGSGSIEVEAKPTPSVWPDSAASVAQRSSEETVARAQLGHYSNAEVPSAANRKKQFVLSAETQIVALSSDEEEIDMGKPTLSLRR